MEEDMPNVVLMLRIEISDYRECKSAERISIVFLYYFVPCALRRTYSLVSEC